MTNRKQHFAKRPGEPGPEFTEQEKAEWLKTKTERAETKRVKFTDAQVRQLRHAQHYLASVAEELDVSGMHCGTCTRYQPINIGQAEAYGRLNSMQEALFKMIQASGQEPGFISTEQRRRGEENVDYSSGNRPRS